MLQWLTHSQVSCERQHADGFSQPQRLGERSHPHLSQGYTRPDVACGERILSTTVVTLHIKSYTEPDHMGRTKQ
jgi:hypothetical protein